MKQRLRRPATRAVAPGKKCDFSPELATSGGGHILSAWVALDTVCFLYSGSCAARYGQLASLALVSVPSDVAVAMGCESANVSCSALGGDGAAGGRVAAVRLAKCELGLVELRVEVVVL